MAVTPATRKIPTLNMQMNGQHHLTRGARHDTQRHEKRPVTVAINKKKSKVFHLGSMTGSVLLVALEFSTHWPVKQLAQEQEEMNIHSRH